MRNLLRRFYGLHPDDGLAERGAKRLALRIGECGVARLPDRLRLLAHICRRRVLDQRVGDGEEVALAAPVRLAIALDEAGAFRDLIAELAVALRRLGHHAEPALD